MPFCLQCCEEYREGFDTCADCGIPLVEKLPPVPELEDTEQGKVVYDPPARLGSYADGAEADIVAALLESYDIPVKRKTWGGQAMTNLYGNLLTMGTELYVPARLLEQTRELLAAQPAEEEIPEDKGPGEEEWEEMVKTAGRQRRINFWLLFGIFWGLPIAIVLYLLFIK
ncbi:MAG: DUF2007 domain-containing protein [Oscillospiraceae bacterium]|nr:DUF2007 domain-containing protein [Oscillospiraceae bacterium]